MLSRDKASKHINLDKFDFNVYFMLYKKTFIISMHTFSLPTTLQSQCRMGDITDMATGIRDITYHETNKNRNK